MIKKKKKKKNLKNLLQNQESFKAESWYKASGTQGLPGFCSNDDSRMTFELSMARSNLHPHTLVGGNVEKSCSENVLKTNV